MTTGDATKKQAPRGIVGAGAVVTLALIAAGLLVAGARASRDAVLRADAAARDAEVARVAAGIEGELAAAEGAVADFEAAVVAGAVDDRDAASLRRYLLAEAIARPGLVELALTTGERARYEADGAIVLEREGRRDEAVARDAQGVLRARPFEPFLPDAPGDPTRRAAFRAAANLASKGKSVSSDLEWTEVDAAAAGSWRRKVVTVTKAIFGRGDRFVGVARASVASGALEQLGDAATRDGRTTFVCDTGGRLLSRLAGTDEYESVDVAGKPGATGDLRVVPKAASAGVAAALAWAANGGRGVTRLEAGGAPWFVSLRPLTRARPWLVGSVVAEPSVTEPLVAARDRSLAILAGAAVVLASAAALRRR